MGFYPTTTVKPGASSSQGQLVNNDDHSFNISLNITMTNSQFFNVLNYVSQGNNTGFTYDLNYNNYTTFALNALSAGSIYLGATIGSWPGGRGYDPGDMGEDIRSKTLSSNMTRTTMTGSHPNSGGCNSNLNE